MKSGSSAAASGISAYSSSAPGEERRLAYVGLTRARQRLYLSFSQTRMLHGQTRYGMRSRFFDELPDAALKWLSPRVQHHWFANPKSWEKSAWDDDAPETGANRIAQSFGNKGSAWRAGQSVAHARFGEGVIVKIEGSGDNARAQINFGRQGLKVLDLSIAKLEKIG